MSKYNVGLKTLLLQGLSEPEFYRDLVCKYRNIIGKNDFPYHFVIKRLVITLMFCDIYILFEHVLAMIAQWVKRWPTDLGVPKLKSS